MSVDFVDLLYRSLPGLYRDKDELGELRRFLEIVARPLAEIDASIAQLYEDLFIEDCREEFIPLIGALVGVDVDPTLPARARRSEVQGALRSYRSKGLQVPLERFAESLTAWRASLVDFSQVVAQVPYVESLNPVVLHRGTRAGEQPAGSGNFFFRQDRMRQPLFDGLMGRPIAAAALAGHEAMYAGVEGRFTIEDRGVDLFTGAGTHYTAVAADLADFVNPKTPSGAALTIGGYQVAIDPLLGRFRIVSPLPLAGNLRVTYSELVPASIRTQTFHIGDPSRMAQLGCPDDPAPYSLDLRAPRYPTEKIGQKHLDNHGVFFTPGRVIANQRPNVLPLQTESGRFTFDSRPLVPADTQGVALQLLDAYDGLPITRRRLETHEGEFCGTPRGFTIRVKGVSVTDPAFQPSVRVRGANLSDFGAPKDATGGVLVLTATDIAVDPQLGRFRLDLAALGARAEEIRVDYLLGPADRVQGATPDPLSPGVPEAFAFSAGGAMMSLRDRFDGTPVSVAIRLGKSLAEYHGNGRGWTIYRNGADVSATLPSELKDLGDPAAAVTPGRIAIDPSHGRFKFPAGFLASGDRITVDYVSEDPVERDRMYQSVAQRLPRVLPAGVVPVIIDTRRVPVDPATVN